jgi:uncharacterized protein with HEPN domain
MNTLNLLAQKRPELLRAATHHRALNMRIFGSVARGEDQSDSDTDFLVDFAPEASLLDLLALQSGNRDDSRPARGRGHPRSAQPVPARTRTPRGASAVSRDIGIFLHHILLCVERIESYTADGREAFFSDSKTQDAVIRNLEIIGQAVRDLGFEELSRHEPGIPWKLVAGLRNVLAHQYLGVDLKLVWNVVQDHRDLVQMVKDALLSDDTMTTQLAAVARTSGRL